MSSPGGTEDQVGRPPAWLDAPTLRAMQAELARMLAWGRDALAARDAVLEVLLARRPGLPLPMLAEAVAAVVPDAEGLPRSSGPGRGRA
jgi:hypothetical protein